jgi:hypothetical protein
MTIMIGASVSAAGPKPPRDAQGALYLFLLVRKRVRRKEMFDPLSDQVRHRPACRGGKPAQSGLLLGGKLDLSAHHGDYIIASMM